MTTDLDRSFPILSGLLTHLLSEAIHTRKVLREANANGGMPAFEDEIEDYLAHLREAFEELVTARDCGAEPGECICCCHLRGEA